MEAVMARLVFPKTQMTALKEKRECEKLRVAIWRWYRLGGRHDKIIEIADTLYATKAARLMARPDRASEPSSSDTPRPRGRRA
jgi:hypothetical protein